MDAMSMHPLASASMRLTCDGDFDLNLTFSRLQDRVVLDEDKWLANLLNKKSSLCRHLDLEFFDEVEISPGIFK